MNSVLHVKAVQFVISPPSNTDSVTVPPYTTQFVIEPETVDILVPELQFYIEVVPEIDPVAVQSETISPLM